MSTHEWWNNEINQEQIFIRACSQPVKVNISRNVENPDHKINWRENNVITSARSCTNSNKPATISCNGILTSNLFTDKLKSYFPCVSLSKRFFAYEEIDYLARISCSIVANGVARFPCVVVSLVSLTSALQARNIKKKKKRKERKKKNKNKGKSITRLWCARTKQVFRRVIPRAEAFPSGRK